MRIRYLLPVAALALSLTACSDDDSTPPAATPTASASATAPATATAVASATAVPSVTAPPTATASPPPTGTPGETATASPTTTPTAESCADPAVHDREPLCALDDAPLICDFLIAARCLLPYPSSFFLRSDSSSPTGFRVAYDLMAMPANVSGVHVDPTEWNRLDGFSPGPLIEAFFPAGVDLAASGVPTITTIEHSLDADSPTILLDAVTGERVPHFAELDVQASSPATQMFLIRPAIRLRDAHHYVVAIRGLVDPNGHRVEPERPFQIVRDQLDTPVHAIAQRRAQLEPVFAVLAASGIGRSDLQLAWDFLTASSAALTGRALSMRDQGLTANGPGAPPFVVESVEEDVNEHILRRVKGHFTVPLFMQSPTPPTRFNLDAGGNPVQNGTATAPFLVNIPRSATAGGVAHAARPILYGHGLLGSNEEVNAGHLQAFADRFNFVVGGTNWIGLSEEDIPAIVGFTPELSGFPALPDRLQQAALNFILMGRLLFAADGLVSHPAFQLDGQPLIDTQELYFYGISQGGIEGGLYMALAPDSVRGVLGVGAANYSLLLQRSLDFAPFQGLLNPAYTDELDRQVLIGLVQQLWDRADPQGYLPHLIADPLPGTPAKKILMQIGVYDSQVSNIGSTIEARSLGLPNLAPSALPLFGVAEMSAPFDGSAFVPYDVNATTTPLTNTPPLDDNGVHEAVRRLDAAQLQIDAFLRPDGRVENFCNGPCFFTDVPNVEQR